MDDEKDIRPNEPTSLEDHVKAQQKSFLLRLEDRAIDFLYSLVERPADNPRFWIATGVGMIVVLAGPAVAIALFFFGRERGFF